MAAKNISTSTYELIMDKFDSFSEAISDIKTDLKEHRKEFQEHRIEEMNLYATKPEHKENSLRIDTLHSKINDIEKNGVKYNLLWVGVIALLASALAGFFYAFFDKFIY